MTPIEWAALLLGFACVALAALRSVWTFPTAIVSVGLVGVLVWRERLYSDALLQLFFVAANLYGWRSWSRATAATGQVPVGAMTPSARIRWTAGTLAAALLWGGAMHALTDAAYPWWDAAVAAASVAAQLLMARRRVENWLVWIAVDLAAIPLYLAKGLHLLALLYLVYLGLALWGWLDWRAAHRRAAPILSGACPA
jgi:nicotinamide mononucleotide transporter